MRKAKGILTIMVGLVLLMQAGTTVAYADGNNGTIKIHEVGTAQADNRNEPKVCDFYIDGFNFDSTSSGQWRIDGQGQTSGSNIRSGGWGPSDSGGNWRTQVIAPRLPDGHYKAAAWQVMPSNPPGGEKTKVFKVECGPSSSGDTGGQTSGQLDAAIDAATSISGQLAAQIIAAQNLLASGTLTVGQQTALTNAINAAISAQAELAAKITAAQNALNALNTAINSGNAVQIAAAQSAAQLATTNLNTAAQANLNLNATIGTFVSAGGSQTNQTTTTTGTTNATTPPIVLGVQTLPAVSGGETSRATQNAGQMMQGVQGLQTLPSTSTGTQVPLAALGGVLMSVGAWLLRKPARRNDS